MKKQIVTLQQSRLSSNKKRTKWLMYKTTYGPNYDNPQYIKIIGDIQRIELHRGCPWANEHDYCWEPKQNIDYPIPKIERNQVQILDMNMLQRKNIIETLEQLSKIRVKGKVVYYEAVCGFDFRVLTPEIVKALKKARFKKIRLAWDGQFKEQMKIKDAVDLFVKEGFSRKDLSLFMIVNWRISREECERKLDLMKVWNIKVCDCCYDAGYRYAVPEFWTEKDMKEFRAKCRKHNQLVNFGVDPEI